MARFIHQAVARRSVVVKCIETMKQRPHIIHTKKNINMNEVTANSAALPEHDVPPELFIWLPLDYLQET